MVQRKFILGEEWLYYKLYCGARTADSLLGELILPITASLQEEKLIHQWFFIRYADPEPHIRLRFKLTDLTRIGEVIAAMKTAVLPYLKDKRLWRIQTDTYTREIERYGTITMENSEKIFYYDSLMASKAISLIEDEELFFLFIFKGVHTFIELFQLNDTDKLAFYKNNATAFKSEFNIAKPTKMSLDKKYRGLRKTMELFLSDEEVEDKEYQILWDILKERNESIEKVAHMLLKHHNEGTLEIPLEHLLSSYVHMSVNRSFRHKQRFYEMVGYDFLERYTRSMLKRNSSR